MMHARELDLRRRQLVVRAEQQRHQLAAVHRELQAPFASLMGGVRMAGSVHPRLGVISMVTTLLTAGLRFTPLRAWWTRGLALYRGGKLLSAMLKQRG